MRTDTLGLPVRRLNLHLCAVYAFMRRCDDITDESSISMQERRQKLDIWLDALHRAQLGHPTDDPILLALTDAQRRYQIPAGLLDELAHGTAMDVEEAEASAQTSTAPGVTIQYKPSALLLPRCIGCGTGLHPRLRLSQSRGRTACRTLRPGFPTHQYYS